MRAETGLVSFIYIFFELKLLFLVGIVVKNLNSKLRITFIFLRFFFANFGRTCNSISQKFVYLTSIISSSLMFSKQ